MSYIGKVHGIFTGRAETEGKKSQYYARILNVKEFSMRRFWGEPRTHA